MKEKIKISVSDEVKPTVLQIIWDYGKNAGKRIKRERKAGVKDADKK